MIYSPCLMLVGNYAPLVNVFRPEQVAFCGVYIPLFASALVSISIDGHLLCSRFMPDSIFVHCVSSLLCSGEPCSPLQFQFFLQGVHFPDFFSCGFMVNPLVPQYVVLSNFYCFFCAEALCDISADSIHRVFRISTVRTGN